MDEDATVKEAEEYNAAGNCAFKDKEYEKAIRFYTYVTVYYLLWSHSLSHFALKNLVTIQIVLQLILGLEIDHELLQMQKRQ